MDLSELEANRVTLDTRSGPVSCIELGAGPDLALFVHGIATNAALWRNVLPELSLDRRCIALDLPLHGRTPAGPAQDLSLPGFARVLEDVIDGLGADQVDLVANDTGGAVAQIFAARHPTG